MHIQIKCWAGLALALAMIGTAQAAVDLPYAMDLSFGNSGAVYDPLVQIVPEDLLRASGQHIVLSNDDSLMDGSTVVAGTGQMWNVPEAEYVSYLVVVRYAANGQRLAWSNPSAGYSDSSHMYLYMPPTSTAQAPDALRIAAVRDVRFATDGGVYVLVDAFEALPSITTDTKVVIFGSDGQYRGTVTPKVTPGTDDVGASILLDGDAMYVTSSSDFQVTMTRFALTYPSTYPVPDPTWGSSGSVSRSLLFCHNYVGGVTIPVSCRLRAQRAVTNRSGVSAIFVAGEYVNSQTSGNAESDLFVMQFIRSDGSSGPAYPMTWGFDGIDDGLRGLALRNKGREPQRAQDELYLLDSFPLPCGNGFIVLKVNMDTGTFMSRTYTYGGSHDTDPNVCALVPSLEANDLALNQNYTMADRYLAVVGKRRVSGELYTGDDAFLAMVDTQDMHSAVQVQAITHNAGQFPSDAFFNKVAGNPADGSYTATGLNRNYDGDSGKALTIRMHPDRIFSDDFQVH